MSKTRYLLREEIAYSDGRYKEINVLHKLKYYEQQNRSFSAVNDEREWMKPLSCTALAWIHPMPAVSLITREWLHSSFNLCVPVTIENWKRKPQSGQRLIVRFPLPYRFGEAFRPGNAGEKICCEAGTYAWLQQNFPDVPIPWLYGFATSTGGTVRCHVIT